METTKTWQANHPATCCGCDGMLVGYTPEQPPICHECWMLINEEDE